MTNIILTTPEELRAIISEVVSTAVPAASSPKELPDSITLETAVQLLEESGFPTSKAKIYKLTSSGNMPFRKYGNKLVFSRKELLNWAEQQTKTPHDPSEVMANIYKSVKRKRAGRKIR
jgi:hypothetical protein